MQQELERLISKYGGINAFENESTQEEKEKYFLLTRAITIEYNDHKFNHRNRIDEFFYALITKKKTVNDRVVVSEEDEHFSLFSKKKFSGKSTIINHEIYRKNEFKDKLEFDSLFQFLVFHKSILFLDYASAKKVITTDKKEKLITLSENIENYNGTVWTAFKTEILEEGIQHLFNSHSTIYNEFLNLKCDVFIFESSYEDLGVADVNKFEEIEIMKQFNYKNYFGKILTRLKANKE